MATTSIPKMLNISSNITWMAANGNNTLYSTPNRSQSSNMNLDVNSEDPDLIDALLTVDKATCWIALISVVVGIVGNIAVILVHARAKKLPVHKLLILHLAVTDLIYSVAHIFWTHRRFNKHRWIFGPVMCKLTIIWPSAISCAMFTITIIAIERYRSIIYPFSKKWRASRIILALLFSWIVAFCLQVPDAIRKRLRRSPYTDCITHWPPSDNQVKQYVHVAGFVLTYPIPLCIIAFCYIHIGWRAIGGFRFPGHAMQGGINVRSKGDTITTQGNANRERKYTKLLLMLALVVVAFVLTTTPNQAMILWFNFTDTRKATIDELRRSFLILHLLSSLVHLHACVNPIIYCISDRKFREELIINLLSMWRCTQYSRSTHANKLLPKKRSQSTRATALISSRKKLSPILNKQLRNDFSANNETQL